MKTHEREVYGMGSEKFSVKFAETEEEVIEAYKLRYNDMLLEYNEDAIGENGLDITEYDQYARVIVCKDNETGEIVGTYRFITSNDLPKNKKFLCEDEFNIDGLKATGETIVELSRAVIKKEYRNTMVLMHLLGYVVKFIIDNKYRFTIGEASFLGTDKEVYQKELSYLAQYHALDERYQIRANEEKQVAILEKEELDERSLKRSLPALIRVYMEMGSKFSKDSFTDWDFGSVDVFVLMDQQNCNLNYMRRIFRF